MHSAYPEACYGKKDKESEVCGMQRWVCGWNSERMHFWSVGCFCQPAIRWRYVSSTKMISIKIANNRKSLLEIIKTNNVNDVDLRFENTTISDPGTRISSLSLWHHFVFTLFFYYFFFAEYLLKLAYLVQSLRIYQRRENMYNYAPHIFDLVASGWSAVIVDMFSRKMDKLDVLISRDYHTTYYHPRSLTMNVNDLDTLRTVGLIT